MDPAALDAHADEGADVDASGSIVAGPACGASTLVPDGVFTASAAVAAGLSRQSLRTLMRSGHIARVGYGLYARTPADRLVDGGHTPAEHPADSAPQGQRELIRARLSRLRDDTVIAHRTAAELHGLRLPFWNDPADQRIWLLIDPDLDTVTHRPGFSLLPAQVAPRHVSDVDGLRITTLPRTALDLGRGLPLERALIPIDHALALGASREELLDIIEFMKGWPGTRVLKTAAALANPLAESALESLSRGRFAIAGIPSPSLQAEVRGASGRKYRADFLWPDARLIGEADGRGKYLSGDDLFDEKRREDDLRRAGFAFIRWTYEDIAYGDRPAEHWVARALQERGVRLRPATPRR